MVKRKFYLYQDGAILCFPQTAASCVTLNIPHQTYLLNLPGEIVRQKPEMMGQVSAS